MLNPTRPCVAAVNDVDPPLAFMEELREADRRSAGIKSCRRVGAGAVRFDVESYGLPRKRPHEPGGCGRLGHHNWGRRIPLDQRVMGNFIQHRDHPKYCLSVPRLGNHGNHGNRWSAVGGGYRGYRGYRLERRSLIFSASGGRGGPSASEGAPYAA